MQARSPDIKAEGQENLCLSGTMITWRVLVNIRMCMREIDRCTREMCDGAREMPRFVILHESIELGQQCEE